MTLWNFHSIGETADFERWGITRDAASGALWYRVVKARNGATSNNRSSLWDALQIAARMRQPFQMKGILKDRKGRACAPDFVFDISDVQLEADGSALWLKLEIEGGEPGTFTNDDPLPTMTPIAGSGLIASARSDVISDERYMALRDAAVRVHIEGAERTGEIQTLYEDHQINKDSSGAVLNNFRCLIEGQPFKSPMRVFGLQLCVDAVVAKLGDGAVPNLVASIGGYIEYARTTLRQNSPGFQEVLDVLKREMGEVQFLQKLMQGSEGASATDTVGTSVAPEGLVVPSEILREVWVRGPQHAAFRRALQRRWADNCSVRGTPCNGQLRASHVVAWSLDSTIRGDVNNGLLLSVPLDSLFDEGLISFDDSGVIICSVRLNQDTAEHFGIRRDLRIAWQHLSEGERQALCNNLARHRAMHHL